MIYVFIDTNIFVRLWTQSEPGCELEHFQSLVDLLSEKKIQLLLPEVVELEIAKNWNRFPGDLGDAVAIINGLLTPAVRNSVWNEVKDVSQAVVDFLDQWKAKRRAECEARQMEASKLLKKARPHKLPLTTDVLVSIERRKILGKLPENKKGNQAEVKKVSQDVFIADTLINFFASLGNKEKHVLYFCSQNRKDFAVELESGGRYGPQSWIVDDLPPTEFVSTLSELVEAIKQHQPPPSAEEVDAANRKDLERKQQEYASSVASMFEKSYASPLAFAEMNTLGKLEDFVRSAKQLEDFKEAAKILNTKPVLADLGLLSGLKGSDILHLIAKEEAPFEANVALKPFKELSPELKAFLAKHPPTQADFEYAPQPKLAPSPNGMPSKPEDDATQVENAGSSDNDSTSSNPTSSAK